jgi:protein-L-isoaspartate(D-aspartate) O-methyltransferase
MNHLPSSRSTFLLPLVLVLCACPPYCAKKTSTPGVTQDQEFARRRVTMVEEQIQARGISDSLVIAAMMRVPRHLFVPPELVEYAYADQPLPIGLNQTISQPYIVALMTELISPHKNHKVLEIGTGSGYQAAVLAEIVDSVWTIEILKPLARSAEERLSKLGYGNVRVLCGDGYAGWPEYAPFDRIIVTAAAEEIPDPLIQQLRDGGKMVIPVGSAFSIQNLVLVEKHGNQILKRKIAPVRFVPLMRNE